MDYEKNKRYFEGVSFKGASALMAWGIIIATISFIVLVAAKAAAAIIFLMIGAGMIVLSVFVRKNTKKKIVTDQDYDMEIANNLLGIRERAMNKLGLDEDEVNEIEPITIHGFKFAGCDKIKFGQDCLYRTNKYEAVMFFFSQHEVHCYTWTFDTLEKEQKERTDVYFYKDIVSVTTETDNIEVYSTKLEYEYFKLTTTGGTSISASVRDAENAQRSINAMRALIKNKKMA